MGSEMGFDFMIVFKAYTFLTSGLVGPSLMLQIHFWAAASTSGVFLRTTFNGRHEAVFDQIAFIAASSLSLACSVGALERIMRLQLCQVIRIV